MYGVIEVEAFIIEGNHFYGGYYMPLIKGKFANYKNVIVVNHLAAILGVTTTSITQIINNNIQSFNQETELKNIAQLLINDKNLRADMGLTGHQVNSKVKFVYVLSKEGFFKLQELLSQNNCRNCSIAYKTIKDYFEINIPSEEAINKRNDESFYLSPEDIQDLISHKKYNKSYVRYTVNLKTANRKVFHNFKRNKIEPYIENLNKDLSTYLIHELGVKDIYHIPFTYVIHAKQLVRDCYIVSDELKLEYKRLSKELDILYDTEMDKHEGAARKSYKNWIVSFKRYITQIKGE